jgi:integrase
LDLYLDGLDADMRLSAKTRFDYRQKADAYVRPALGPRRVRDVTPDAVLAWQRTLLKAGVAGSGRQLSPNTVRLARAPLAGAFKLAVSMGLIATNPMTRVPRPRMSRSIPRHWSPEEARTFLGLMEGDRTWPIWAFLMGSGLRLGELVALRWESVDLVTRVVRVVDFTAYLGYETVVSSGKSRDAVRSVDIDDGLVKVLQQQRDLQQGEQREHHDYELSDFVFTTPSGGPYHPQYLSHLLGRLCSELGLPRLSAHGLRHTCATLMLASGVPPKVAAERLGHADPSLFMTLYSHVSPTMQREAADRIGAALFG